MDGASHVLSIPLLRKWPTTSGELFSADSLETGVGTHTHADTDGCMCFLRKAKAGRKIRTRFGLLQNLGVLSTALTWENGSNPLLRFASIFAAGIERTSWGVVGRCRPKHRNARLHSCCCIFIFLCVFLLGGWEKH